MNSRRKNATTATPIRSTPFRGGTSRFRRRVWASIRTPSRNGTNRIKPPGYGPGTVSPEPLNSPNQRLRICGKRWSNPRQQTSLRIAHELSFSEHSHSTRSAPFQQAQDCGEFAILGHRPPNIPNLESLHGCGPSIPARAHDELLLHMQQSVASVSYTHLRAHETRHDIVCR